MKYQTSGFLRWVAVVAVGVALAVTPSGHAQVSTGTPFTVFNVGTTSAQNNLTVNGLITGAPGVFLNSGAVLIGGSATVVGGSFNTVTLSNALLTTSAQSVIGFQSSFDSLTLLGGSVWNGGGTITTIGNIAGGGSGTHASNDTLSIFAGAIFSNAVVNIGTNSGAGVSANSGLIVSNGGFAQLNGLNIAAVNLNGGGALMSNNYAYVSNITVAASAATISRGAIDIGMDGSGNTGTLYNVMWTGNGGTLSVSAGKVNTATAQNNSLILGNGSVLTNFGDIAVGYDRGPADFSAQSNSLIVTGAKTVLSTAGNMFVGGANAGNARNANTTLIGGATNSMSVLAGATVLSTNLWIGEVAGVGNGTANTSGTVAGGGNVLHISGAGTSYTNQGNTYVGAGLNFTIIGANSVGFGGTINSSGNKLVVDSGATLWTTNLTVGLAADIADYNGVTTNSNTYTTIVDNNQVIISNGASVITTRIEVGATNALFATGGSPAVPGGNANANVGGANATAQGNSVYLTNNALLEVGSSMVILAGPSGGGNTISNYGSTYQFTTATPTIINSGYGNIAINNGTISFRAVNNADVTNNLGNGALSGIQFNGNNIFALNAASTKTSGQTYTYGSGQPNGPSNYVALVMVNGQTAYNGGDITVASTGSMLVSNTFATISGLVTNQGSLTVVAAAATFQGAVYNSGNVSIQNSIGTFNSAVVNNGTWASDPSSLVFSGTFSNGPSGVITMGGADSYTFKSNFLNQSTQNTAYNTQNGLFIFAGSGAGPYTGNANAAPTQTMQVAGLNLGGYGTTFPGQTSNDIFFTAGGVNVSTNSFQFTPVPQDSIWGYTNNFAVGRLTLQNTTLELSDSFASGIHTAGLYVGELSLGSGSDLIISNDVQVYFMGTNGVTGLAFGSWAENPTANVLLLDGSGFHAIIVVPEPSILLMWVAGLAAVYFVRRRRRAPVPVAR